MARPGLAAVEVSEQQLGPPFQLVEDDVCRLGSGHQAGLHAEGTGPRLAHACSHQYAGTEDFECHSDVDSSGISAATCAPSSAITWKRAGRAGRPFLVRESHQTSSLWQF